MTAYIFVLSLSTLSAAQLTQGFHVAPVNTAVVLGKACLLVCAKNDPNVTITWLDPNNLVVARNDMIADGYDVMWTKHKRESQLCIRSATMSSAGEYTCQAEHNGHRHHKSAQLIVVESHELKCHQNKQVIIEGEELDIVCEMNYTGLWAPVLEWRTIDGVYYNYTNETTSMTAIIRLTVNATRNLYRVPFKCTGSFIQQIYEEHISYARKTTRFHFLPCTIATVVHWPVTASRIKLFPEKVMYLVGETVTCMADTNPLATYIRWRGPDDGILSNTATLKIGRECLSPFCYCEVGNYVGPDGQQQLRFAKRYLGNVIAGRKGRTETRNMRHKPKEPGMRKQRSKPREYNTNGGKTCCVCWMLAVFIPFLSAMTNVKVYYSKDWHHNVVLRWAISRPRWAHQLVSYSTRQPNPVDMLSFPG